ncbi:MAG: hypothetical protein JW950_12140, partial [Deltaproteobacteria bacterium]|nr:hypothetical protein [Deltaproteobacteria bacterium]
MHWVTMLKRIFSKYIRRKNRILLFLCVLLLLVVGLVFGQTAGHEFINYDDGPYVYENPVVQKGLTLQGLNWALTYGDIGH